MTATHTKDVGAPPAGPAGDGDGTGAVASSVASNPWETLARERKARAVATTLLRVLPTLTADEAAQLTKDGRRAAASLARVKPCSEAAWDLVVEELRRCGR